MPGQYIDYTGSGMGEETPTLIECSESHAETLRGFTLSRTNLLSHKAVLVSTGRGAYAGGGYAGEPASTHAATRHTVSGGPEETRSTLAGTGSLCRRKFCWSRSLQRRYTSALPEHWVRSREHQRSVQWKVKCGSPEGTLAWVRQQGCFGADDKVVLASTGRQVHSAQARRGFAPHLNFNVTAYPDQNLGPKHRHYRPRSYFVPASVL